MAKVEVIPLSADEYSVMQFFTSLSEARAQHRQMCSMGWAWARESTFANHREGPCFFNQTGVARHNIYPLKKADGTFSWRCTHPMLVAGDAWIEFGTPVACAVAQEIQHGIEPI